MRVPRLRLIQVTNNLRMSVNECENVGKVHRVVFVTHGDKRGDDV